MPRLISFSGGRSSAMMLKILLENGLQSDDHILFANTGKERPETLDFIHEIETRWNVPIVWIEGTYSPYNLETGTMVESIGFRIVNYETASRDGRPFSEMIDWVNCGIVPNRVSRFCTKYLKVVPMQRYLESEGVTDFDSIMGIRYDEPARYRKYKGDGTFPLVDMRVTEADVFRRYGQITHFIANMAPNEAEAQLSPMVFDRLRSMCTSIEFTGKSKRV